MIDESEEGEWDMKYIAAMTVLMAGTIACADTVDVRFTGTARGRNVTLQKSGSTMNVFAGQLKHTLSNGTGTVGSRLDGDYLTFCTDLDQYVTSTTRTYEIADLATMPKPAGGMGESRAQAIRNIFGFASGQQFVNTSENRDFAAAFQLAVWEIAYDFNSAVGRSSLGVSSGSLIINAYGGGTLSSAIQAHLNDLFDAANDFNYHGSDVIGIASETAQDQILNASIPLPSAALSGGLGLAGLAASRRRR
ncbi:MAG: Cys-Gln thioester bond-forming surface protein [Phycisphaerales bacterium]|nr:Cys-Gln thioester bond-forming surface protein [Phycisphaerales bacterium]